ncbi:hypothetical protein pb186bvf_020450 [Paramecium bursaria]
MLNQQATTPTQQKKTEQTKQRLIISYCASIKTLYDGIRDCRNSLEQQQDIANDKFKMLFERKLEFEKNHQLIIEEINRNILRRKNLHIYKKSNHPSSGRNLSV